MRESTVLFWVLKKIKHRIPMMLCLVLADAGIAVFGVLFALGSQGVIDSAVAGRYAPFARACMIQLGIILGALLCIALARYIRDRLVTEMDMHWKQELAGRLLRGEYAQVSAFHSGELINRLNNDVRALNDGLVAVLPSLVSMFVRLAAAVAVLFAIEPVFTVLILVGGVAAVIGTGFARRGLKNLNKQVSQSEGKVLSFLQEALERLLVVQAMDLAPEVERRADGLLTERMHAHKRRRRVSLVANTGVSVLYYMASFAALVWCAFHLLQGSITFGTLTAVTQLVGQIQAPFVNLSGIIPQYAAIMAAAERLMELDRIKSYPRETAEDMREFYDKLEWIRARDLSFAYEEDPVFQNADFSLPKGAFAAITGASGIGKSTLLKLMLGVFSPKEGELVAGGHGEERTLSRRTRGLFAYVPQGNFLFSGTVRDNLLIGNPQATPEEIEHAIYVSAVDQFLWQMPNGLDSEIGENGEGLSEGQVQRLAVARAVLSGAPILLLDEATSSMDVETERIVLERIAQLADRTCIIVSHRPAALELADWQLEVADRKITIREVLR